MSKQILTDKEKEYYHNLGQASSKESDKPYLEIFGQAISKFTQAANDQFRSGFFHKESQTNKSKKG